MITEAQIEDIALDVLDISRGDWLSLSCRDYQDIEIFAREIVAEYEASKWVKFNSEDESTWPPIGITDLVVTTSWGGVYGETVIFTGEGFYDGYSKEIKNLTHWQPLPKPPMKK